MDIYQIVYVSTPSANLTISEIRTIVAEARLSNDKNQITGFLCANSQHFLQCLEGDKQVITELFGKIESDSRHHTIELIGHRTVTERSFPHWGMGVMLTMEKHQQILNKYKTDGVFNPYQLNYEQCLNLLTDFSHIRT